VLTRDETIACGNANYSRTNPLNEDEWSIMLRRTLLMSLGIVGLGRACAKTDSSSQPAAVSVDESDSLPPHYEALSLVFKNEGDQIKTLEHKHASAEQAKQKEYVGSGGRWWFDTDERTWSVTRPFGPGGIDSTHWFVVTYSVGAQKLSWSVDTRKRKVRRASNPVDSGAST
jgi:hypothetical protein